MSRDPEKRLADLGEVPDAAAERVVAGARARVERALQREPRRGERVARRRRPARRLAIVVAACAIAFVAVLGTDELQDGREQSARAAVLRLSSFDAFTRAILRHEGMLGTAPLTQEGRADAVGHRLFVGRSSDGATCVIVVAHRQDRLVGARCAARAIGDPRRRPDVFWHPLAPGRYAVDGLVGAQVQRVEVTGADGRTRSLTPRNGVFGAWVDSGSSLSLLDGDGRTILQRAIGPA